MKNILTMMLLCATVILSSCQKDESATRVSEVTINKTVLALTAGAKETLTATVLPVNAMDKRVTWSSSNTLVAAVSQNGEVAAFSAGTAIITVSSVDDKNKTANCKVTVTGSGVAVTEVKLNKPTLSLLIGGKETLVATVLPDNATNKSVTWESSNTAVATVSQNGEILAIATGTATITTVSVTDKNKKESCLITVVESLVPVTLVGINNKPLSLLVGGKETLSVTVLPDNATDKSVTWRSSDVSVATVSSTGEVVAVGTGVATITVASVSDNTKTDECVVTVTAPVVTTAAVGNFYYSDNTQTEILDKTKLCIGVVFWVDSANNQKGKIVSLDETELEWSSKTETTGTISNLNGRDNMRQLNVFVRASANSIWGDYPAFNWVATAKNNRHVGGWDNTDIWYLPAQGDLVDLYGNMGATVKAVNASLKGISGAVALTANFYCSSTEKDASKAVFVSLSSGFPEPLVKFSENKVRAIAAF